MALMRSLRRLTRYAPKAKQLAEQNAGKIAENVNKATDFVDDKTKGRYTDQLRKVDGKANDFAAQQGQAPAGSGSTGTDTTAPDAGRDAGRDAGTDPGGPDAGGSDPGGTGPGTGDAGEDPERR